MDSSDPRGGPEKAGKAARRGLPLAGVVLIALAIFGPGPVACSIVAVVLGTSNDFRQTCTEVSPGDTWQQAGTALENAGGRVVGIPDLTGEVPDVREWGSDLFPMQRQSCSLSTDDKGLVTGALYESWLSWTE